MTARFKFAYASAVVLAAAAAAVLVSALVLAAIGVEPFAVFAVILTEPLKDTFGITEILVRSTPLILVALGISIAFRSGVLNIGAEGQIIIGIAAATAVAVSFPGLPKPVLLPLTLLAGAAGGAVWGGIAGTLKAKRDVNEILSTVMLNYIAAQLYGFLLRGPMIDPEELTMGSGTPQSVRLPRAAWLDRLIPGTRLHAGLIIALVLAVLVYVLLWRTTAGFRLRAAGAEPKAARYAGIRVQRSIVAAMLLSGAFAGLAGAVELSGVHRRAIESISSGYGFSGIVVALFAGLNPALIPPAAFFFGLLLLGADMTQRSMSVPANMVYVLQGAIILAIVSAKAVLADQYAREKAYRLYGRIFDRRHPETP
ncbi:MAG: ABC transporter permease [Treponema sp. GWB1_62_6]|nr:MAG: ABC transporter permease [Treponema sp. GWC1_61_84]OHE67807.1 MAG: ABC transporter permease [Treponema sp. GWB1_62_6]OHE72356.1 MAG: ABC transporter permease [Treponema sp. RIFOXYC1_FULL_61_9]HCM25697.1 ABC transporter permease [Treponema sp.]